MKRTIRGLPYVFEPNDDRKRRMLAEFGIDCDGVCEECCGPCPPHLADGTSYRRQPSDYVQPQEAAQFGDIVSEGRLYEIDIAGTFHRQEVLEKLGVDAEVELEFVPEPGNWYDPQAVCVDVEGRKVGYLHRELAVIWHRIIRAINTEGYRVMTTGVVEKYESRTDNEKYLGLTAMIPDDAGWVFLHRALGFDSEFYAVFSRLPATTRDRLLDYRAPWDEMVTPDLVANLFELRSLMPNFDWERLIRAHHLPMSLPGQFVNRVRAESSMLWARRQRWRAEMKNRRERARVWERSGLYEQIVGLRRLGWTLARVGEEVGRSPGVVSKIIREFEPLAPAKKAAIDAALARMQDAQADVARATTAAQARKANVAYEAALRDARQCGAFEVRYVVTPADRRERLASLSEGPQPSNC
jgi:hypothetical protein